MKKYTSALALAAAVSISLATAPSWAAESLQSADSPRQSMTQSQAAAIHPSDYTGKVITTHDGQRVGTINSLVSKDSNHDTYALIDVDKRFGLGIGADRIVLPVSQLQPQGDHWKVGCRYNIGRSARTRCSTMWPRFSAFEISGSDRISPGSRRKLHNRSPAGKSRPHRPNPSWCQRSAPSCSTPTSRT